MDDLIVSVNTVNLSEIQIPKVSLTEMLAAGTIVSLQNQVEDFDADITSYALTASLATICEYFWEGSTARGVLRSNMFQVACDSASFMVLQATDQIFKAAAANNGIVPKRFIWTQTRDMHAPFAPVWNGLSFVMDPHDEFQPCLLWGFEEDLRKVIHIDPPEDARLN